MWENVIGVADVAENFADNSIYWTVRVDWEWPTIVKPIAMTSFNSIKIT